MQYDISSTISLVSHIHSAAADFLRVRLTQRGLPDFSSSHGFILFLLSKEEKFTMSEISRRINRDKSTTTALVKKLEKNGFVECEENPSDGRSKCIKLTSRGLEYNKVTAELSNELIKTFYKDFSEEEKHQIFSLLSKVASNFESEN